MGILRKATLVVVLLITTATCRWVDVTEEAALQDVGHKLVAFGDFNADRRTDIFVVDGKSVLVYLADDKTFVRSEAKCQLQADKEVSITNVVPADYDYDGLLDVLIAYNIAGDTATQLWLCKGDAQSFEAGSRLPHTFKDQPAILDVNGDFIPDMFGESPSQADGKGRGFLVWNSAQGSYEFDPQLGAVHGLRVPHSSAFVDIDGDCLADIFVTSVDNGNVNGEIWRNNPSGFSSSYLGVAFPSGIHSPDLGQFSFADMDADGATDIIVPICSGRACESSSFLILFNKRTGTGTPCEPSDDYGFVPELATIVSLPPGMRFAPYDKNSKTSSPVTVHVGDYDLDGHPDVLAVVVIEGVKKAALFVNKACEEGAATCTRRTLSYQSVPEIEAIANPITCAFFDYAEDIIQDVMVVAASQHNDDVAYSIHVIRNSLETDAFFFKATVLNGKCSEWCADGERFPDPQPFGVNAIGPSVALMFSDINGNDVVRYGMSALPRQSGSQFTQTCYDALQTPYLVFGLGRTTNYVDKLYATIPYTANKVINRQIFQTMIPNSQVVVVPYEPQDPSNWAIRLFLIPSHVTLWVAISTIAVCSILALVVFGLHIKEKYEDEAEKRRTEHLFNYNAM